MRLNSRLRLSLRLSGTLCAAILVGASGSPVASSQEADGPATKACLYQGELRTTNILDDRTILFMTHDGQAYRNTLPRQCPGLRRGSLLNYTYEGRRLCAGSMFQLLLELGGQRMPTFVCPLGLFVPISDDEAQDLIDTTRSREGVRRNRRSERDMIKIEPAEPAAPPPPSPTPPTPPTE